MGYALDPFQGQQRLRHMYYFRSYLVLASDWMDKEGTWLDFMVL